MIEYITLAKAGGTLDQFFKRVLSCQRWIIDEWAAVHMNHEIAEEVFVLAPLIVCVP